MRNLVCNCKGRFSTTWEGRAGDNTWP